ncbi:hypothetical protein PSACC_01346 [Paramicrosporidium saccamoebae]|uniref:Nucleosome assembly protein n=1 Tax=Paramicrosporidium saccamoebae TaxID=1246581 RepID=A0A2H9TM65_9FUNG|nr:hypothetical protein PSACC_01346 [Paramicrosporidium saccamoebae]
MKRETFDMGMLKKKISEMEHDEEHGCCDNHDYLSDLPLSIRKRVYALEHLHSKRSGIANAFREELLELERKYLAKYVPLNEERYMLVNGKREPTAEELANFTESGVEELGESSKPVSDKTGIPNFWLTALQTHPNINALITEVDSEVLSSLLDIRVSYLPGKPGFKIDFEFAPNDFFSNTLLSKEYHLANPDENEGDYDDFVYDHAVGTEINWKGDKNLCFKTIVRTQRHRTNNSTRTVKREEPQSSFFHFFIPPVLPENADDEEDSEDINELEARLQINARQLTMPKNDFAWYVPHHEGPSRDAPEAAPRLDISAMRRNCANSSNSWGRGTVIMDDAQRSLPETQMNDNNTESIAPAKRIKFEKPIGADEFSFAPESIVLGRVRAHIY